MTLVVSCCLWVLLASLIALLPMRHQYVPGLALLLAAPALLIWIVFEAGLVWACLAVLAFVSLFRKPLRFIAARAGAWVLRKPL
ncbi:MAG: DUF2484 family protein [Pseudomonadota bacterium]